jgi:hypothetical protein
MGQLMRAQRQKLKTAQIARVSTTPHTTPQQNRFHLAQQQALPSFSFLGIPSSFEFVSIALPDIKSYP